MVFIFRMLSFKSTFSLSSFTFIKRLLSSSSLSAIRLVSSPYLKLLIFLLVIWNSDFCLPLFIVIHAVKVFGIVNKAEIGVYLKLSCFFHYPSDVGNSISGSSVFPKTNLNIWKFMVCVLLKLGLENFEHYFTSV